MKKKLIIGFISLAMAITAVVTPFGENISGIFDSVSISANAEETWQDAAALNIANGMKDNCKTDMLSFKNDGKFASDLAKEIVTKENVLKFCGDGFSTVAMTLVDIWKYKDLLKSAGEKGLYMYLCFTVIDEGISYMDDGDRYFSYVTEILNKYGDGEITDPNDARKLIKNYHYGAKYYICGQKYCMAFIDDYANGKTLSSVFEESLFGGVTSNIGDLVIGKLFEFKDLNELWNLIDSADSTSDKIKNYMKLNIKVKPELKAVDDLMDRLTVDTSSDNSTVSSDAQKINKESKNTHSTCLTELSELTSNQSFGNVTITDDLDLSGKTMTVNGDLIIKSGTVDLNGGTLNVTGNLRQEGGEMYINNGTLNVDGDYKIQTKTINNIGVTEYSDSSGYLVMNSDYDKVNIGGDFVTQSHWLSNGTSNQSLNYFTDGTMVIGGNFYQYDSSGYGGYNFVSASSHKVIFKGNKTHSAYFESTTSKFNYIDFEDGAKLKFDGPISSFKIFEDVEIEGDIESNDSFDLDGHALTIHGNFRQTGGKMYINNGTLNVDGDYKIQTKTINNIGVTEYSDSSGYLVMNSDYDKVNIGGDFVTQSHWLSNGTSNQSLNYFTDGTMVIGGNFYQYDSSGYGGYNFVSASSHKVIFKGTGKHTVHFDSKSSKFNILQLSQPKYNYDFSYEPCWNKLIAPECDHNYIEEVITPTEKEQGYTLHTCTICGDSYKDNYTDYKPIIDVTLEQIDINGDGKISTADVGLINAHAKGTKLLSDEALEKADVNNDGKISTADVGLINAYAKGTKKYT